MKSRKGFTLIELLIVVLILGALAAIAIPRIAQSTETAKINACATNVDMMNSQIELWAARHDDTYPTLVALTGDPNYFPEGLPVCPFGTAYEIVSNNRVTGHTHP